MNKQIIISLLLTKNIALSMNKEERNTLAYNRLKLLILNAKTTNKAEGLNYYGNFKPSQPSIITPTISAPKQDQK